MTKARVSISFDDGRFDNLDVIERILTPSKIPATIFISTGYVDGSCPKKMLPTNKPAMTIEDVRRLHQNPFVEIGLHGDMHLNEDLDIKRGREKLLQWLDLNDDYSFGFASPGTSFPIERFIQSDDPLYTCAISYLAMGTRFLTCRNKRLLCRKAGRVIHSNRLFQEAYQDTLMQDCSDRVIYRVPILRDTSASQIISLLQKGIQKQQSITLMFHSIGTESSGDLWTWSNIKFEALYEYLCEKRATNSVELCTTMQVFQSLDSRSKV